MMQRLGRIGERGILFFPVTPFHDDGSLDLAAFRAHVETRLSFSPDAVFVACGTGEFYALGLDEYEQLVAAAVEVAGGIVPVIAGAGYGAALASEFLRRAERAGADGILAFPPGATIAGQAGLLDHYRAIAASTSLPIIVYQRDRVRLLADTVARLLEIDNIVGLKDGSGDLESVQQIRLAAGDRWSYFNGMPTAELSSAAYAGLGIRAYSSAVFAFLPEVAVAFRRALFEGDAPVTELLLREFFAPFASLRDRGEGYAVSLIKAGLRLRGEGVGPVRAPLANPTREQESELAALISHGLELV